MTDGEKARRWALVYLYLALATTWFNVACIVAVHIKEWV